MPVEDFQFGMRKLVSIQDFQSISRVFKVEFSKSKRLQTLLGELSLSGASLPSEYSAIMIQ